MSFPRGKAGVSLLAMLQPPQLYLQSPPSQPCSPAFLCALNGHSWHLLPGPEAPASLHCGAAEKETELFGVL